MAKGWRKSKKPGTKNKEQAAARDERAAAAAVAAEAADRAAAAELLADLATQEEPPITSPCMVVKPQPRAAGQRARWRAMIIWKYVELGRPSSKRWRGRGGTLAVISRWLEQHEDADKRPIENVLTRYVSNEAQTKSRTGVQQKLTQGESAIAADALAAGHSKEMVSFIIWEWRLKQGKTDKEAKVSKCAILTVTVSCNGSNCYTYLIRKLLGHEEVLAKLSSCMWSHEGLQTRVTSRVRHRHGCRLQTWVSSSTNPLWWC